jgi:thiol-disulfide isomerase/thioredoxin
MQRRRRLLRVVVTGVWVLLGVIALVVVLGITRRRRDGLLRTVTTAPAATPPDLEVLSGLGFTPGSADVTFVQFSSAFCQPCRATRAILSDVANTVTGVRHLEVDAEAELDAVRALGILRTPTTLVLDRAGFVMQRASGQPRKADVIAAVGRIVLADRDVASQVSDGETQ